MVFVRGKTNQTLCFEDQMTMSEGKMRVQDPEEKPLSWNNR